HTLSLQFAHSRQRKNTIMIPLCVLGRIAEMPDIQLFLRRSFGNNSVRRIFTMESGLITMKYPAGTHQSNFAMGDGFDKGRPGRRLSVDHPSVGCKISVKFTRPWNIFNWHPYSPLAV